MNRLEEFLRQGQTGTGWAKGKRPWKQRYYNINRQVISRFLAWAKKRGYTEHNAALDLDRLKEDRKKPRYLRKKEMEDLLKACRKYDEESRRNPNAIEDVVRVILGTGARISEVVDLRWEDVNFDANRIRLTGNKTKSERVIPLSTTAKEVLRKDPQKSGPVFPDLTSSVIPIKKVYELAGLPKAGYHLLRHTFAAHLATAGVPLRIISTYLGHSFGRTTELYAHLVPSDDDRSMDAIDEAVAAPNAMVAGASS